MTAAIVTITAYSYLSLFSSAMESGGSRHWLQNGAVTLRRRPPPRDGGVKHDAPGPGRRHAQMPSQPGLLRTCSEDTTLVKCRAVRLSHADLRMELKSSTALCWCVDGGWDVPARKARLGSSSVVRRVVAVVPETTAGMHLPPQCRRRLSGRHPAASPLHRKW